ncbi:hypothetical protein [Pacificimonas flava]|uniref:hypothetical protein n=1 Tax=Pacificimonas flava TaxID=1234595 RepID=UPI00056FB3F2|nr:hypothetical protein [Pacificimonas flava]MBB5280919.1 hypothetical protein [Pacificimonas flava]
MYYSGTPRTLIFLLIELAVAPARHGLQFFKLARFLLIAKKKAEWASVYIQSLMDRHSFDEAAALVAEFGPEAVVEAAFLADSHRTDPASFARWRQVERAVLMLQLEDVVGELH